MLLLRIFVEFLQGLSEEGEDDVDDLVGYGSVFLASEGVGVRIEPIFQDLIDGLQVVVYVGGGCHVVGEGRGDCYDCVEGAFLEDYLQIIGRHMQDEIGQ